MGWGGLLMLGGELWQPVLDSGGRLLLPAGICYLQSTNDQLVSMTSPRDAI
jgi:hypothetical protein